MIDIAHVKIATLSRRLNRFQDRQDLESIRQLVIALHDENERLKSEVAKQSYRNSEQINDTHELIRYYENRLGYW